ncbi:MAG: HD domain-containing protein [Nitrospirae bacterium]|jgi:HD-GYP domain-containing protein (c-di-GMP phosphodiesterase class II)|nr:HD domain-containing protein [Nitrospirota bacterium]
MEDLEKAGIQWKADKTEEKSFRFSEVVASFTYALDMTEGQPPGHCLRSCRIGMEIGRHLSLSSQELWNLYYAILLKDAGCSSNAARLFELYSADDRTTKKNFKTVDTDSLLQVAKFVFSNTAMGHPLREKIGKIIHLAMHGEDLATEMFMARCERGAHIATEMGFNDEIAHGIRCLDEHWNGKGRPRGLKEEEIPLLSRIALLSQVADVFSFDENPGRAREEIKRRRGTWFDPELVDAFDHVSKNLLLWEELSSPNLEESVLEMEPLEYSRPADDDRLDQVSRAFGKIIDAKSPYTYGHSQRVGDFTYAMSKELGFSEAHSRWVRRGGFLHDVGKLGISNTILDKPGRLSGEEYEMVKNHARYTEEILIRIGVFRTMSFIAGAHHERLDGGGYPRGLRADRIPVETRIITIADIFDALTEERPYRKALSDDQAFSIMEDMRNTALDSRILDLFLDWRKSRKLETDSDSTTHTKTR